MAKVNYTNKNEAKMNKKQLMQQNSCNTKPKQSGRREDF